MTTPDLTPADVMQRHQLARSTAYEHMRRALGRPRGVRGVLRVPVHVWDRYYASLSADPVPEPEPRRWTKPKRAEEKGPPVFWDLLRPGWRWRPDQNRPRAQHPEADV